MIQLTDIESRLPDLNLGRHLSEVAAAASVEQRSRPRRWPLALFALIAGAMAVWTVVRNDAVRVRASAVAGQIRSRTGGTMMGTPADRQAGEPTVAFPATDAAPITSGLYETPWDQGSDYPAGLRPHDKPIPVEPALSPVGARSTS